MFMIVKYGDGNEEFFNTDCRTKLILDCIKHKCDGFNEGSVDIADESGEIMFLHERKELYGSEFLKPRGTYVLVRRETCDKNFPLYTPLLSDQKIVTDDFMVQLNSIREKAIKEDEDQRLLDLERLSHGKGKGALSNKRTNKDANFKRSQSQLMGISKKMSRARPSR